SALLQAPADVAGAGERDQLHAVVLDEDVADLGRSPDDHVEPAGGQTGFRLELREQQRGKRRLRRRLQYNRTARCKRGGELVRDEIAREVERRDGADDPDRSAYRERELALAGLRRVHRDDFTR